MKEELILKEPHCKEKKNILINVLENYPNN